VKYLILSDCHSNLDALQTAADLGKRLGVQRYVSLGDHVLYGLTPPENDCLDFVRRNKWIVVRGNHEYWAQVILEKHSVGEGLTSENVRYISRLPTTLILEDRFFLSHTGLSSEDLIVETEGQAAKEFEYVANEYPSMCGHFMGHYHIASLFAVQEDGSTARLAAEGKHRLKQRFIAIPGACNPEKKEPKVIVFDSAMRELEYVLL